MASEQKNNNWNKTAKKVAKKTHRAIKWIAILFLALGFAIGYFGGEFLCSNDRFVLNGETNITIPKGTEFTYYEEGATVISFGRDISSDVITETDLTASENGTYPIDTSEEKVYTITYTIDDFRYGSVQKIRFITVIGG
jgi:hypothetical protein